MSEYKGYGNSVTIDDGSVFVKNMLLKENFTYNDIVDVYFVEPTIMKNGCLTIQTHKNKFDLFFLKKHLKAYTELYNILQNNLESNFNGQTQLSNNENSKGTNSDAARCPKCGSTSITLQGKKLSLGRAVAGNVIAGPLGGAVGAITSKQNYCICLRCGHKWKI